MIAVALDPARVAVAVAGRGPSALRRATLLAAGAPRILLFCDTPAGLPDPLPAAVELRAGLPDALALAAVRVLWIAGLPEAVAAVLAASARRHGVLVNVEDRPDLCDFHSVAEVRRGDLLLTVSTGGRSPGLAARVRAWLAEAFGPEWATHTVEIATLRQGWRAQGWPTEELARATDDAILAAGWLH